MQRFLFSAFVLLIPTMSFAQALERPTPSTQPGLTSIDGLTKLVPEGVIPKPGREWNTVKVQVVQQALDQAVGRTLTLPAAVTSIHRDRNEASVLQFEPVDNESPTRITARIYGMDLLALARMDVGDRATLKGMITKIQLRPGGGQKGFALVIELDPAELVGEIVKTEPPATRPAKE
jgi:hypothetical protein